MKRIAPYLAPSAVLVTLCALVACRQGNESAPKTNSRPRSSAGTVMPPTAFSAASAKAPAAAPVPASAPAMPVGRRFDPEISPDFGEPGVAVVDPKLPAFDLGMMDHADRLGWTDDSQEFGYCVTGGGLGDRRCGFVSRDGKLEKLSDVRPREELDPAKTAALNARIAKHSRREGRWRYARDLVLTWSTSGTDVNQPSSVRPELRVGARVRGASRAALPITLRGGEHSYTIHPEAIALSPDGTRLAVLSHAFAGEFSDTFELRVMSTDELAAQAYNVAGLDHHQRGEYSAAAPLFHRAAHADPSARLPMYNLACALARQAAPESEKALELAIQRGGPDVKAKARRDPDFEAVRDAAWFIALVR